MRKPYEKPKIVIELFPKQDVIVCSGNSGELPGGGDEDEPIDVGFNGLGSNDA